ncbi:protein CURVATURE THYLAKOID 1C, chloroplastic-like isoform X2 [Hevea brasiliensis]|uniref:protein CURVATURE THYLAKOID 1C, chloroplastic-like isoform X2 n=1 Tax=Hevea brasiliensis TaxID=3981 RepID=UPI0025F19492|nr:protein CURVATURE THYLAKOID 1C, chloroplastic-like isoform X2 [Hevea brasiliensis]
MASIVASLPPPALVVPRRSILFRNPLKLLVSSIRERQNCVAVVVKAAGESSESSTSLSIVKSVQNIWDKSEDRLAIVGLGFAAIVALWASANLISWFVYRYLLFKPEREELFQIINKSVSDVLGL